MKELYAFVSFGCAFPKTFSSLVDSYNTKESGLKNFLLVALALSDLGYTPLSVRLDSGDLADLSKFAKILFKETGDRFSKDFTNIKVVASNDLNETAIKDLIAKDHKIDIFGVGTHLVTCQAQPAMGMVYKVCEFRGVPRIKLSEEAEKTTIPGSKKIVRAFNENNEPLFDVLYLVDEEVPESSDSIYDRLTGKTYSAPKL